MYTVPGAVLGAVGAWSCGVVRDASPPIASYDVGCGLSCPATGVLDGNASISGVASVDAFFGSVVRFRTTATAISDGAGTEIDAIALSVGAKPGDLAGLGTKLAAKLGANLQGGLRIAYQPPECTASTRAVLAAESRCDATVDPERASVECEGGCTPDVGMTCGAGAALECTGIAPNLSCTGTCKGVCELETAAKCEGICRGACSGNCNVGDARGGCAGSCDGMCRGRCELDAAASCSGTCKGVCTYAPVSGQCEPAAQAHCNASATGKVECRGQCSGRVTPASASADCEASAKADASVSASCDPPPLNVSFQLAASVSADPSRSAEFQAWLVGFERHVSALLASKAKLDGLVSVGTDLAANAEAAIKGSIDATLRGAPTLRMTVGLGCALAELPSAIGVIRDATAESQKSSRAIVSVLGIIGAS
jgi:hypothetical protein